MQDPTSKSEVKDAIPTFLFRSDVFFENLTDLSRLKKDEADIISAKLNKTLQIAILDDIGKVSDSMAKELQLALEQLDYKKLKDVELSTCIENVLSTLKQNKQLVDEASEIELRLTKVPSKKIGYLLHLDTNLLENPIFYEDIKRARTLEYSKLANLSDTAAKIFADKNLDLNYTNNSVLLDLVKEGVVNDKEKEELQLVMDLGKLTGDNLTFIKALKTPKLKSIADFADRDKSDWQELITKEKISLPPGKTADTYAETIALNIEKTYPSQFLLSRLINPSVKTKLNSLDSLNSLQNNRKLNDSEKPVLIDWIGIATGNQEATQKDLQDLAIFVNTYHHLDIAGIINNKELDISKKKDAITTRLQSLSTFYKNNSSLDLRLVNFFDKGKEIDWKDISADHKPHLRKQLMAYQRILHLSESTADSLTLLGRGYHSAVIIADKTEEEFIRTSGLETDNARRIYEKSLDQSISVMHYHEAIRDVVRGQSQNFAVSNLDPKLINNLREIDGFDAFFGSQDYCECDECRSILSPSAYFVDLMRFIKKHISDPVFSNTLHPLYLKNRREDLWDLELTCDNTNTEIPYLTIVNEILEAYLAKVVTGNIFKKLSQSTEKISFSLPFNLSLEELKIYLSHFEISLYEIYDMLNQPEEKIWRAKINISQEEFKVITTFDPDVKLRFGNPIASLFHEFNVQDFIRYAGISREQLTELLSTKFNSDISKITVYKLSVPDEIQNFPEIIRIRNISNLDFIHRFIRLWKKTTWSIPELDLILTALKDAGMITPDLSNQAISNVSQLLDIQERLHLTVEELCTTFHSMPTWNDFSEHPDRQKDWKLFERTFDVRKLFGEDLTTHKINSSYEFYHKSFDIGKLEDRATDPATPVLLGGLGVSETELFLLFDLLKSEMKFSKKYGVCTLNLQKVSLLYRHSLISNALNLKIKDFVQVIHLNFNSTDYIIQDPHQIRSLIEFVNWVKTSPFTIPELGFILKDEESNSVKHKIELSGVIKIVQHIIESQVQEKESAISTSLQKLFNFTDKQFEVILKWVNVKISVVIERILQTTFTNGIPDNPENLEPLSDLIRNVERLLLLFTNFKFKEETIAHITENMETLGIANRRHLTLDDLKALTIYKTLITLNENAESLVNAILSDYNTNKSFSLESTSSLSHILEQDQTLIKSLTDSLEFPDSPIKAIEYLQRCLKICQTLGINGNSLENLAKDGDFTEQTLARDIALGALISKYKDEKIRNENLESYQDQINVIKRDALCDYIIARERDLKFKDLHDVYAFFLLDIEMGGCFRTSRLVCGISSLQLYVHRWLLNLEQSSTNDVAVNLANIPIKEWEWRKNFRVWGANREVSLHPEIYIDPDLLDTKTIPYKELEDELLQTKITKNSVETAYKKYISQFIELAHLKIAGSYYHDTSNTYYLFGCTQLDPPQYYYRKWIDTKVWTSWEKIDLAINSNRVSAIIYLGKLYLFWLEFTNKSENIVSGGNSTPTVYRQTKELKYSFMNEQGRWIQPQKSFFAERKWLATAELNNIVFPVIHTDKQVYVFGYDDKVIGSGSVNYNLDFFRNKSTKLDLPNIKDAEMFGEKALTDNTLIASLKPVMQNIVYLGKEYFEEVENKGKVNRIKAQISARDAEKESAKKYGIIQPWCLLLKIVSFENGETHIHSDYNHSFIDLAHEAQTEATIHIRPNYSDSFQWQSNALTGNISEPELYLVGNSSKKPKPPGWSLPAVDYILKLGNEQYLVKYYYDLSSYCWKCIRVNTSLSDEFGEKLFNEGLDSFLSLETQKQKEHKTGIPFNASSILLAPSDKPDHIDFDGSYGEYYWELFFHIPFLIANSLNANQKFEEAKQMYEIIFNPSSRESTTQNPTDRNWQFILFRNQTIEKMKNILTNPASIEQYKKDPFNPHAIARLRISAYQKAIVMKYIDNLLDWGDKLFAKDTMESINEAEMLYVLAFDILGKRPAKLGKCAHHEDITYKKIEPLLNETSEFLISLDNWSSTNATVSGNSTSTTINVDDVIDALSGTDATVHNSTSTKFIRKENPLDNIAKETLVFCVPPNYNLLSYWDRVEDRLFKIRNCMNIDGVRRNLALFQPRIDPMLLIKAKNAGLSLEDILPNKSEMPPYRFSYLIEKAKQFTQTVQGFGSALLSALEKKDLEELTLLRSVHERNILQMTKDIKKKQINEAQHQYQTIVETKTNIQNRIDYYQGMIDGGLTAWEITQQISKHTATGIQIGDSILRAVGASFYLIPQVGSPFAMKFGGKELGDSANSFADFIASTVRTLEMISSSAGLEATFQRRDQEWKHQLLLAKQELKQMDKQLLAAEIRISIAEKDLEVHEKNIEHADDLDGFYKDKFTNLGLYNYLSKTLYRLYRGAYNIAYDMAIMAEKSYQFETDHDEVFIQPTNFESNYAGLLAGEHLTLQLEQMDKSYITQNKRDYEITQSFSLALFNPEALVELKQKNICNFEISELMFDLFYPGQYKRIIKSVRLSIPCIVGPYVNTGAKLTLTNSKVRRMNNGTVNLNLDIVPSNRYASIATSNAQNDAGVFELNFKDERYLPFEGAGAVSEWKIELPGLHSFDYNTISDVIMHISYTAKDDGAFRNTVETQLRTGLSTLTGDLYRLISLKHEFPDAFHKLLHSSVTTGQTTDFELGKNHFPYFLHDKNLEISSAKIYLNPKNNPINYTGTLNVNSAVTRWEGTLGNMKKGNVALSGSPIRKWIINTGTNTLDKDNLDDILILVRYRILPSL